MADKLLKLKLDMVYRDFPMEEAKVKFDENIPPIAAPPPTAVVKRKLVKPLLPKSK